MRFLMIRRQQALVGAALLIALSSTPSDARTLQSNKKHQTTASVPTLHLEVSAKKRKKTRQVRYKKPRQAVVAYPHYDQHSAVYTVSTPAAPVVAPRQVQQRAAARPAAAAPTQQWGGGSSVVEAARRYVGMTASQIGVRATLWCGAFMEKVAPSAAARLRNPHSAREWGSAGTRVSGPQVGAIAVMSRKGGGHVGVVSGIDANGNPIVISGNSGGRKGTRHVTERSYPRGRIYAFVMP